jgi:hypothetical protein
MSARIDTGRLEGILGPDQPEITCEQCFEYLDAYVELELASANAEAAVPGFRAHLTGCPACHEDHDSLLSYVSNEQR